MKTKLLIITMVLFSTIFSGCKDDEKKLPLPGVADCMPLFFMDGYNYYKDETDVYLIKGVVLGAVNQYGLKIKLIDDLKGNFSHDKAEFNLYGDYPCFIELNRWDYLPDYGIQDTLILLLTPAVDWFKYDLPDNNGVLERVSDYATMGCTPSVLKLSKDYVTGYILPYSEEHYYTIDTVLYNDFLELLGIKQ